MQPKCLIANANYPLTNTNLLEFSTFKFIKIIMIRQVQCQMKCRLQFSTSDRVTFILFDYIRDQICRVYQTVNDVSLC